MLHRRTQYAWMGVIVLLLCGYAFLPQSAAQYALHAYPRSLRLPNTTHPLHYYLDISTNIHNNELTYRGNVTIDIEIKESTNEIVLHAKNLTDFFITVHELATGDLMEGLTYMHVPGNDFLVVYPVEDFQAFEAGQKFRMEILYTGRMQDKTQGLYWLTSGEARNPTVYIAATQFEPTSARLALPCYDEPAFKAHFTIRLTHSSNYTAISNMMVDKVDKHASSDLTTTTFRTSPPMSTYLVAFVISNFEFISEEYRGVTQRVFTSPNTTEKGHKALKNAVRTVAALEDYFGIKYPLAKLDHFALNKNYGAAMENWGLITYKEDNLVHQDQGDMHKKLKDILTQNHEISHQWFGNLVSPEWWSYAWLNEGFATYFSYLVTDMLYPEMGVMDFFLTDIAERAYSYNFMTVRPMTFYVEQESEIINVFDIITYQKAACVIKMFHHAFNQKTFVRGISMFLRKFEYAVANERHLFDAVQAALSEDDTLNQQTWSRNVSEIMLSWTHSEWIPVVMIKRNYADGSITIRQRSKDQRSQEHWWIPINFATASQPVFESTRVDYFMPPVPEVTLTPKELGIDELKDNDWLIANKQQTGFYHVLYDTENLAALAKQLQRNHAVIHPLNRAAIFQDLCPLIENNDIDSVEVVFELLKYLQYEENVTPWNNVADTVEFLEKHLFGTAAHTPYKLFIRQLVTPIFKRLFLESHQANFTNTEILARQNVMNIACMADVQECLSYTRTLAHGYIFGNNKFDLDQDYYGMQDSILCLGVKYLSDAEFDAILTLLSKPDADLLWYDDLIYSLRCTQSRTHLHHYLNLLLGVNSTRSLMNDSESMMYLFYLYKANMMARPVMWRFFEENYKLLCRSTFFIENFNRIAEYVPQRFLKLFLDLRQSIYAELKLSKPGSENSVIEANSPRIGGKVKLSEAFVADFGPKVHEWLLRERDNPVPPTYAASIGVRSAAPRISYPFRLLQPFLSKLF